MPDLVFDLGMNDGADSAFYLAKRLRVVAVEANPELCAVARIKFAAEIASGRMALVDAAVAEKAGCAAFHVNLDNSRWSSLDLAWASREGSATKAVGIYAVTLAELVAQHGAPRYLKVDIEGADGIVIKHLRHINPLPEYVSFEDCRFALAHVWELSSYGYRWFNLIDQSTVSDLTDAETGHRFSAGSSGPLGCDLPGPWRNRNDFADFYHSIVRDKDGNRIAAPGRWFDIHAWTGRP